MQGYRHEERMVRQGTIISENRKNEISLNTKDYGNKDNRKIHNGFKESNIQN